MLGALSFVLVWLGQSAIVTPFSDIKGLPLFNS